MKPKDEKTQITLRLPKELNDLLQKMADETGISKNAIIVTCLWNLVKNK